MLVVSEAANSTALTTLVNVKDELQIKKRADDNWLNRQIGSMSSWILGPYGLKVPLALDGTRNCGRETLVETFRADPPLHWDRTARAPRELSLSRWRGNLQIQSIVVDDDTTLVEGTDYELREGGLIYRLDTDYSWRWYYNKVVVTYVGGWLLPNDQGRDLPPEIEDACIELVKMSWFSRERDPAIRSESTSGIDSVTYFNGTPGDGPLPAEVDAKLQGWRY